MKTYIVLIPLLDCGLLKSRIHQGHRTCCKGTDMWKLESNQHAAGQALLPQGYICPETHLFLICTKRSFFSYNSILHKEKFNSKFVSLGKSFSRKFSFLPILKWTTLIYLFVNLVNIVDINVKSRFGSFIISKSLQAFLKTGCT